jgi:hypothetical protein
MRQHLLLFVLLVVVMSGCRFIVRDSEDDRSFVPEPDQVTSIHIRDYWIGLSPTAPHIAEVTLLPTDGGFSGDITFSARDLRQTETVFISQDDVKAFLDSLAESALTAGDYEPKIEWTDDYPTISIEIHTADGEIQVYSSSQGDGHVPWGMTVDGTEYVIDSDQPSQALQMLQPDLHYDVFSALIDEAQTQ